jgi:sirohydrochlorin ferrochelatase
VTPAFASAAAPTVGEAVAELRRRGAPRVAVASYLLFPGVFADRLAAAGADVTSAALGAAPEVARLVLARYDARRGDLR